MLVACWAVKGGVGTTVVSVAAALGAADVARPTLLVDLAGDVPACLGIAEPQGPGVAEWLAAGTAPPDALARLEVSVAAGLSVLHRGAGPLDARRASVLLQVLASSGRPIVVDAGRIDDAPVARRFAAEADRSLLVTRACVLALRRAAVAPVRPSGVVLVREPGRALSVRDVEATVGAPVVADVAVDPAMARAVDAGLALTRLPRQLSLALGAVAA
ncbi:MAG TPA: hypothetical protein VHK88_18150 [Aquihabitans sp.]|nr:hypothetical protein [Aquihabitans sp.]